MSPIITNLVIPPSPLYCIQIEMRNFSTLEFRQEEETQIRLFSTRLSASHLKFNGEIVKCDEWAVEKRDSILCTYVEHGGLNLGGEIQFRRAYTK